MCNKKCDSERYIWLCSLIFSFFAYLVHSFAAYQTGKILHTQPYITLTGMFYICTTYYVKVIIHIQHVNTIITMVKHKSL